MSRRALGLTLGLLAALLLAACGGPSMTVADLPAGDAARGAEVFVQPVNTTSPCATCHSLDGTVLPGPTMQGFGAVAGERVASQSAEEYSLTSIIQPAAHLVPGFGNLMYGRYGDELTKQQIADLIAYMLTL